MTTMTAPFPTLAALEEAHYRLLDEFHADDKDPSIAARIKDFLAAIGRTGRVLVERKERLAAQRQLDFWCSVLYQLDDKPPRIGLDPWDASQVKPLRDEDFPYSTAEAFQELAGEEPIGWTRLLRKCLGPLEQGKRLVAIIGPPRSGRSFLLHAGLLPALRRGRVAGSKDWHYAPALTPTSSALENLDKLVRELSAGKTAVVVIDGLELLFSHCPERTADAILEKLVTLLPQHVVLLTLRSDYWQFLDRPARQGFRKHVEAGAVHVQFDSDDLRQIIETPARRKGLKFQDDRLVDQIIRDVQGDPESLQLLLFSLRRLWQQKEANTITWQSYLNAGAGRGALSKAADELFASLSSDQQATLRGIFLQIVRVKPTAIRELVLRSPTVRSLAPACGSRAQVTAVLTKCEHESLLRLSGPVTADTTTVSLAQESLVGCWPELEKWKLEEQARLERRKLREKIVYGSVVALLVIAVLVGGILWLLSLNRDLNAANIVEKRLNQELNVSFADQITDNGARLLEAKDNDVSGALLYMLDALHLLEKSKGGLSDADFEAHKRSHYLRLGVLLRRQPELMDIIPQKDLTVAEFSPDRKWLALAAGNEVTIHNLQERSRPTQILDHGAWVRKVVFDTDGKRVLTGGNWAKNPARGEALLWTRGAADEPIRLGPHGSPVAFLAIAGNIVVTVNDSAKKDSRELWVWSLQDGRNPSKREIDVKGWQEDGVLEHPVLHPADPRRLAIAVNDKTANKGVVKVLDLRTGAVADSHPQEAVVNWLSFDKSGRRLAAASGGDDDSQGEVRVYDQLDGYVSKSGQQGELRRAHDAAVLQVAFSPDGQRLVSVGADSYARIWDLGPGPPILRFELPHQSWVYRAEFSDDGQYLVTAARDQKSRIWDAERGQLAFPPLNHTDTVLQAVFGANGQLVYTQCRDTVTLWKLTRNEWRSQYLPTPSIVNFGSLSEDGAWAVLVSNTRGGKHSQVRVWQAGVDQPPRVFMHADAVRHAIIGPKDHRYLATVSGGARSGGTRLQLWRLDANDPQPAQTLKFTADVNGLLFSPDGTKLLTLTGNAESPGEAQLWNLPELKPAGPAWQQGALTLGAFSSSGRRIATIAEPAGQALRTMIIWDVGDQRALATIAMKADAKDEAHPGHSEEVTSIAFDPRNEEVLATSSKDDSACLWNVNTPQAPHTFKGHKADVTRVAFNHDGSLLATASLDLKAMVWDVNKARQEKGGTTLGPHAILEHSKSVIDAFYCRGSDFSYLTTVSADGTARLWEPRRGKLIIALNHPGRVPAARFERGADGDRLAALVFHGGPLRQPSGGPPGPELPAGPPEHRPKEFRQVEWREWDLTPLAASAGDPLESIGEVLAARRRTEKNSLSLQRLLPAEVVSKFAKMRGQYQAYRKQFQLQDPDWHLAEAERSELLDRWESARLHLEALRARDAKNIEVLLRLATVHSNLANKKDALANKKVAFELAIAIVKLGGADWRVWKYQGDYLHDNNEWDKAHQAYSRALMHDEARADADLWEWRAMTLVARAKSPGTERRAAHAFYGQALADYGEALALEPGDAVLYFHRAEIHKDLGRNDKAADDYANAVRYDRKHPEYARRHAEVLYQLTKFDDSFRAYWKAGELYLEPNPVERLNEGVECLQQALSHKKVLELRADQEMPVRLLLAKCYVQLKRRLDAEREFDQLRLLGVSDIPVLREMSEFYMSCSQWDKAIPILDDLIAKEKGQTNVSLLKNRARALLQIKRTKEAVNDFTAALKQSPQDDLLYGDRAEAFAMLGSWDKTARDLDEAIAQRPDEIAYWYRKAIALLMQGDIAGYQRICRDMDAQFANRNDASMANDLIWTSVLSPKPEHRLLEQLNKSAAPALDLNSPDHLNTLGSLHYRLGHWQTAVETLEKARVRRWLGKLPAKQTELKPGEAIDLLVLSMALTKLGQTDKAKAHLNLAVSWIDEQEATPSADPNLTAWNRAEWRLFRKEAEDLLGVKK